MIEHFSLTQVPEQKDKIAIVTGANIGLGFETALGLASKGVQVVLACRNEEKANKAAKAIQEKVKGANVTVLILDLERLESVREFAQSFTAQFATLDLLILNAGIMVPPFALTVDGFERQMGVNYFAQFYLTKLLFPTLKATKSARVITLSSMAHRQAKINFEDINSKNGYSKFGVYGQSKLACLMFAFELQRRIEKSELDMIAVSVHPGGSNTNLAQYLPNWLEKTLLFALSPFLHSPENAALPTLMAALDPEVKGGMYLGPTGFNEVKGKPGIAKPTKYAQNQEYASRLWKLTEDTIKTSFVVE